MKVPTIQELTPQGRFVRKVPERILAELKKLLETKHLYQSVKVGFVDLAALCAGDSHGAKHELILLAAKIPTWPWKLVGPEFSRTSTVAPGLYPRDMHVSVQLFDFRAVCNVCKKSEPFNVVSITELVPGPTDLRQVHAVTALCQGCKKAPECFLIMRRGEKLTLCGRAPMETVEVPPHFPLPAGGYITDAVIAFNSGQTLAGIFFLRVFVEQWVRQYGGKQEKIDQALEWYLTTLDDDFKSRFPSLSDVYGKLSAAIHKADASKETYAQSLEQLAKHFRARELYGYPATAPLKA